MAEEEERHAHHGLAKGADHGHGQGLDHESKKDKKHENLMFIGVGLAAAGLLVTMMLISNRNSNAQAATAGSTEPTVVNPSTPFVPNGTDESYGQSSGYWPEFVPVPVPGKSKSSSSSSSTKKKKSSGSSSSSGKPVHTKHNQTSNRSTQKVHVSPQSSSHTHTAKTNKQGAA